MNDPKNTKIQAVLNHPNVIYAIDKLNLIFVKAHNQQSHEIASTISSWITEFKTQINAPRGTKKHPAKGWKCLKGVIFDTPF